MMKNLLFVTIITTVVFNFTFAQNTCNDGILVFIPDENLRTILQETVNTTESLTCSDLLEITKLTAPNKGIKDLSGLEIAENLSNINLSNNSDISDWSALANLKNITVLTLANNSIDSLDFVSDLEKLRSLNIAGNQITSLEPIASLSNLITLILTNNQVSDLYPLLEIPQIRALHISNNPIDLEHLKIVAALPNISNLAVGALGITDFEDLLNVIGNFEILKVLIVSGNNIEDFSKLSYLNKLEQFTAVNSDFTDLKVLKSLTGLQRLNLNNNVINDITDISTLTQLTHVYLSNTNISDLTPLIYLQNLTILHLQNLKLQSIDTLVQNPILGTLPKTSIFLQGNCLDQNDENAKQSLEARGAQVNTNRQITCE